MRLPLFLACLAVNAPLLAQPRQPVAPNHALRGVARVRDACGVPQAFAATGQGACYDIGWATAQDRLLQLEGAGATF